MTCSQHRPTEAVEPGFENITRKYPSDSFRDSAGLTSPICREVNFPIPPSTSIASAIVSRIRQIHTTLSQLDSLRPGPTTNQLFTELVGLCCVEFDKQVVQEVLGSTLLCKILPSLRNMCSNAEYELELHWAKQINGANDVESAKRHFSAFPYAANYEELTRMEMDYFFPNIIPEGADPVNVLFIGSGPLPMTSMCLLDFINQRGRKASITNIDRCPEAIQLSEGAFEKIDYFRGRPSGSSMEFLCQDASETGDATWLQKYHIVYLAALVGETVDDKVKLIKSITSRLNNNALVIIRSAHSLRKVLYTEFPLEKDVFRRSGLVPMQVVHPLNNVVNSVIIAAPEHHH
ncbi:Nicotianamine synthase [Ascobolus immersus RN42]|uniref:Nicotianamine synthase n=1 Tax=Ascobolus immersus RN42 TaxID=1160509 RepID=A0A3N4I9D1_ASCIM|nr:Nicotianamine synthase [Ascobolus immersus RN42]